MAIRGYTCDRCRQDIPIGRTVLAVQSGALSAAISSVDLCQACAGELAEFLKTTPADVAQAVPKRAT